MAKRKSKSKSGILKSQTIIILTIIIVVFLILIFRPGIIASILNPLMLVLLIISILVNAFLAYKILYNTESPSKYSTTERIEPKHIEGSDNSKEIHRLTVERGQLMTKVRDRDFHINQLNMRINELENTINTLQSKRGVTDSTTSVTPKAQTVITPVQAVAPVPKTTEPIPAKPTPPKNNSLFFDGPYDDRLFSETNAAPEKRHRYVYRIEYSTADPSVGKLYLEPTADEYDILRSYSDTVLKPACAFDNAFYTGFHNINQLAPGTVHKQGNDWYVKEKVKIRFN